MILDSGEALGKADSSADANAEAAADGVLHRVRLLGRTLRVWCAGRNISSTCCNEV